MPREEERCILLLKKIIHLDEELLKLLSIDNSIDDMKFYKVDNTLYKSSYSTDNRIVCWYGYNNDVQKIIRTYYDKSPIDIYIYIDEITHKIVELEFLDWANKICKSSNCIDSILDSQIRIEYLPCK